MTFKDLNPGDLFRFKGMSEKTILKKEGPNFFKWIKDDGVSSTRATVISKEAALHTNCELISSNFTS